MAPYFFGWVSNYLNKVYYWDKKKFQRNKIMFVLNSPQIPYPCHVVKLKLQNFRFGFKCNLTQNFYLQNLKLFYYTLNDKFCLV